MNQRKTQSEIETEISNMYNGEYSLISKYENAKSPIMLKHKCGHIYSVGRCKTFTNEDGGKCPKCRVLEPKEPRTTKKVTFPNFENKFFESYDGYVFISQSIDFSYDKKTFVIKHLQCGTELTIRPKDWCRTVKLSCKVCANDSRREKIHNSHVKGDYLKSITDGTEYEFIEEYKNNNKLKHTLLHKTCNRPYEVRPNDFQQGYRCPHCSQEKSESYACTDITNFLIERNIPFEKEKKIDGCVHKSSLRFDFSIKHPIINKLLLIEYDGEQHFVSSGLFTEDKVKLTQERDKIKNKFCEDNSDKYILKRIHYKDNHLEKLNEFLLDFL